MGNLVHVNLVVNGAAVDVSAMGKTKTVIVGSVDGNVNVEYATDAAGTAWASLASFQDPGNKTVDVAAHWMRATGGSANVDVAGSAVGSVFAQIPTPADGAAGATVDISNLPLFKTVVVSPFEGTVNIEASEDGTSWAQVMTFHGGGGKSLAFYGALARAKSTEGAPTIYIGGANEGDLTTITAPLAGLVYRPEATGDDAPGGNVFTTWAPLMAVIDQTKHLGLRVIQIDDRFSAPVEATIPEGIWNMTNTKLINVSLRSPVFVEVADGCKFIVDPPPAGGSRNAMHFEGYGFFWRYDGVGDVTPFEGIDLLLGGNNVRFYNTDENAKPMFKATAFGQMILLSGDNRLSGLGPLGGESPAPVYDVNGKALVYLSGGGILQNNVFTDNSLGGGGFVGIGFWSHGFVGDPYAEFDNPLFIANGGLIDATIFQIPQTRYIGYPVVTPTIGPGSPGDTFTKVGTVITLSDTDGDFDVAFEGQTIIITGSTTPGNDGAFVITEVVDANNVKYTNAAGASEAFGGGTAWQLAYSVAYGEYVMADTRGADEMSVVMPRASTAGLRETVAIKDWGGNATAKNVTVLPQSGDTVDDGVIDANDDCKIWVSDGVSRWMLTSVLL